MKFCHQCGKPLTLGVEKFCPFCGANLQQKEEKPLVERDAHSIGITDTKGDVFGAGVSGSGNIIGKELNYNIQANTLFLINPSKEQIGRLENIKIAKTQLDTTFTPKEDIEDDKIIEKRQEVTVAKQQISQVLEDVNKISRKEGKEIQEIRAENIQISRNELLLKEYILKGNEHLYKKEYSKAIIWYDKAIEIDPNDAIARFNKRSAVFQYQRRFMEDFFSKRK